MDPVVILFVVAVIGSFIVGVVFQKYVISEAESIKKHVTDEVAEIRADVAEALGKVEQKVR